ncbi:MAG TPA: hypothetical protein VIM84_07825 [Gemmatimonadales bacterium]
MPLTDLRNLPFWWARSVQLANASLSDAAKRKLTTIEVSFETGETTTHKIYFPDAVTIQGYRVFVVKALAGTDAGTIEIQNSAGTRMTPNGLITLAASTPLASETNGSQVFTANNQVSAGDFIQIIGAKTTKGGRARLTIEYLSG